MGTRGRASAVIDGCAIRPYALRKAPYVRLHMDDAAIDKIQ